MAKKALTPLQISEDKEKELVEWALAQLQDCETAYDNYWQACIKWRKLYDLRDEFGGTKNFPFPNSCAVVVPTIPARVDGYVSRINNAVFGGTSIVNVTSLRQEEEFNRAAPKIQQLMEYLIVQGKLNLYHSWDDGFMEDCKLGNSFHEIDTEFDEREYPQYDEKGREKTYTSLLYEGPKQVCFPVEHFRISPGYSDPQIAPVVGRKLEYTNDEFLWAIKRGIFSDILKDLASDDSRQKKAASLLTQQASDYVQEKETSEGKDVITQPHHDIYRLWCSYDLKDEGTSQEITLFLHKQAKRILNCWWNYLRPLRRPYHIEHLIRREHSLFGTGVIQRAEGMASVINTIFRQTIDASRLANTVVIATREQYRAQLDRVWMGKALFLVNPKEDIFVHSMGQINPASLNLQNQSILMMDQAVGLTDVQQGQPMSKAARPVGRDTMARLQEANKRIDWPIRDIRQSKADQLKDIFLHILQFEGFGMAEAILGPEAAKDLKFLWDDREKELSRFNSSFGFKIVASSAAMNKETEIVIATQAQQMIQNFNTRALTIVQQSQAVNAEPNTPPELKAQMKEKLAQMFNGERDLLVRALINMDIFDAEKKVPDFRDVITGGANVTGAAGNAGVGQPAPGGVGALQGQPDLGLLPGGDLQALPAGGPTPGPM